jgi:hypothetical protein
MSNTNVPAPKPVLYGIARLNGKPLKIEEPQTIPNHVWDNLSQEDKDCINEQVDDSLKRLS